ncbi:MAG: PaaI family thioesterase [Sphingopyxis sp.]|nr:PaaI family thioesterase [Sphingopyxis sp.]
MISVAATQPSRSGWGPEVQPTQCNRLGFCHGGLLSTFLDIALGVCAIEICGHDWGGPTINLSVDFLQGAPMGDWIESRVTLEHTTRSLMFVTGSVVGSPGKIARATALFKQPRPAPITA